MIIFIYITTSWKSIFTNFSDTIWNCYIYKWRKIIKNIITNFSDTIWNCYIYKWRKIIKNIITNFSDTIWNCYIYKWCAIKVQKTSKLSNMYSSERNQLKKGEIACITIPIITACAILFFTVFRRKKYNIITKMKRHNNPKK